MTTTNTYGELVHINPHALSLGDNVRTDASIGVDFVASIALHGVLQPISAVRVDDDVLEVRDGQRRTLAARQEGLSSVPVYVVAETSSDPAVERITHQFVANELRRALTPAERINAVEQMLNLGVTPTKAAKSLGMRRSAVEAVVTTATSERARREAESGNLTLEQAACLAEFESDERAADQLTRAARSAGFDHVVAQLREQREERARIAAASAPYVERGFTILSERPRSWNLPGAMEPIQWLRTGDGDPVSEADIADPALWSLFLEEDLCYTDTATGEPVDDDEIDWSATDPGDPLASTTDADESDQQPQLVPAYRVSTRYDYVAAYWCNDPAAAGLTGRDRGRSGSPTPQLSEAEAAEKARAERRRVIGLNRLFKSSTEVRARFLRNLVSRRTPPATASVWTAAQLVRDMHLLTERDGLTIAGELLGGKTMGQDMVPDGTAGPRAQVITLALVLGSYEARARKNSWRQWTGSGVEIYLRFLRDLGYQLSEIEEVLAQERQPRDVTLPETGRGPASR